MGFLDTNNKKQPLNITLLKIGSDLVGLIELKGGEIMNRLLALQNLAPDESKTPETNAISNASTYCFSNVSVFCNSAISW